MALVQSALKFSAACSVYPFAISASTDVVSAVHPHMDAQFPIPLAKQQYRISPENAAQPFSFFASENAMATANQS